MSNKAFKSKKMATDSPSKGAGVERVSESTCTAKGGGDHQETDTIIERGVGMFENIKKRMKEYRKLDKKYEDLRLQEVVKARLMRDFNLIRYTMVTERQFISKIINSDGSLNDQFKKALHRVLSYIPSELLKPDYFWELETELEKRLNARGYSLKPGEEECGGRLFENERFWSRSSTEAHNEAVRLEVLLQEIEGGKMTEAQLNALQEYDRSLPEMEMARLKAIAEMEEARVARPATCAGVNSGPNRDKELESAG